MKSLRRAIFTVAACLALAVSAGPSATALQKSDKAPDPRPKITLRAQPPVGTTPQRVVLTAELVGGANDFEDYYCPSVEWDWGDETKSESTIDCEPYESGKSVIKRRFTVEHVFRRPGAFKVFIRLKRKDKTVAAASTNIQVRPGGLPEFDR
jgi:hypothetical protein